MSTTHDPDSTRAWDAGGTIILVALVVNFALLIGARVAGVDMTAQPSGGTAMEINGWLVFATTVVPLLIGGVLLYLTRRSRARAWPVLAVVGLAIGVLTTALPLTTTATVGTKTVLALMHLATGLIWFVVVMSKIRGGSAKGI